MVRRVPAPRQLALMPALPALLALAERGPTVIQLRRAAAPPPPPDDDHHMHHHHHHHRRHLRIWLELQRTPDPLALLCALSLAQLLRSAHPPGSFTHASVYGAAAATTFARLASKRHWGHRGGGRGGDGGEGGEGGEGTADDGDGSVLHRVWTPSSEAFMQMVAALGVRARPACLPALPPPPLPLLAPWVRAQHAGVMIFGCWSGGLHHIHDAGGASHVGAHGWRAGPRGRGGHMEAACPHPRRRRSRGEQR
jgi:hypothetical protein